MSSAYRRLTRKITIENLWIYVLSLLRDGPVYGYEVRDRIFKRFGFRPGKITCYVVLYKLEKENLISSRRVDEKSRGAPRKYYFITEKGLREIEKAKKFLIELAGAL
ncbi:MAG: PadR family transcriptional regulator [Thaumarchaeota archaeon]|jgi:DNA-binding PadR family transcriptional regulator|nr:PadR family transcriptional regulator [Candidatus Geocrenenecus arthurdayi]MCL7388768.1 PadR family transcriptional regulator [Candidatus Geocrenenecus arthurdayi]MCL7396802.1 PadR family transcriptional regulator [Candidatus Geocrenenecus arthurdayi]